MKKKKRNIYPIIILIATLFMGIGYASVNSVLFDIKGTVQANLQDGVYITDVAYNNSVTADYENSKIIYAHQTMLNSNIILSDTDKNSSITYEITIYNSNNINFMFEGVNFLSTNETYSNEDITFSLDGLSNNDILKSKESITFTITFYYKNKVLSDNNVLTSLLNFSFKKYYTITYENFSSTGSYPTYVIEGETLTVSFGTLDAPIEVKKSGTILSSSKYSYSNYTLTLKNVNGNIHIRKLRKYTITNIVKNGSFENGLTNWTVHGTASYWQPTTIAHVGSKAYYRKKSASLVNYITQSISWVNGNKYYYFVHGISTNNQNLYCDVTNKGGAIKVVVEPTKWTRGSTIFTPKFTGNNNISINYAQTTNDVIIDGIGVVDLTAAFGSGNEPDLTWCNANIAYFDGSTIVYK